MRIIIELPRLNENHKSLANIVNKNVAQLTFTTARPLEHRDIVQVQQQKLQICSNYFDWHYLLIRVDMSLRRITSGIENFVEMQLFRNLFNPFFYTFSGQFRLTVFVDSQTDKVVVISQTF